MFICRSDNPVDSQEGLGCGNMMICSFAKSAAHCFSLRILPLPVAQQCPTRYGFEWYHYHCNFHSALGFLTKCQLPEPPKILQIKAPLGLAFLITIDYLFRVYSVSEKYCKNDYTNMT